jgi:hypothetical protein
VLDRHEFVAPGGVELPFAAVVAARRSGFTVEEDDPRTVRRAWLDTVDWRLHRAGLTLEHLRCAGGNELSLSAGPGLRVSARLGGWTWPGRVDGLVAGGSGERKRCKHLRYLMEYFASLHDPTSHQKTIKELKSLQDCLGRFQDTRTQREVIRVHADQMAAERAAPAVTLLAMGQLGTGLESRQRDARGEFASRFNRFASTKTARIVEALPERATS